MTDRKTDRELLDELERAYEVSPVSVNSLHKVIVSRFRDLLDRVDNVENKAEELRHEPSMKRDSYIEGYCACLEDLSDE